MASLPRRRIRFCKIDARLEEKGSARQLRIDGAGPAARADDTAEIPNRGPKIGPLDVDQS